MAPKKTRKRKRRGEEDASASSRTGSSLSYETMVLHLGAIRALYFEANNTGEDVYRVVVDWLFKTADGDGDFAARVKQERDGLHSVYQECYGSKDRVDTLPQFAEHLRRNTYASQCFLICKKIVQCVDRSAFSIDRRAADLLLEHWNRTLHPFVNRDDQSHEESAGSSSVEGRPSGRARYNCRTILVEAFFPAPKGDKEKRDKVPSALHSVLYVSVLHTSITCNVGPLKQTTKAALKISSPGLNFKCTSRPSHKFYRVGKPGSGKSAVNVLGGLINKCIAEWDRFARFVGWRNIDILISPYLYMDWDTLRYKVVPEGKLSSHSATVGFSQEGCAPVDPSSMASTDFEFAYVLYEQRDPSSRVSSQKVDPDKFLRSVAKAFVEHFYAISLKETFYIGGKSDAENVDGYVKKHVKSRDGNRLAICITDVIDMDAALRFGNLHGFLVASNAIENTWYMLSQPRRSAIARRRRTMSSDFSIFQRNRMREEEGLIEEEDSDEITPVPAQPVLEEEEAMQEAKIVTRSQCPPECSCNKALSSVEAHLEVYARLYHCRFEELIETDNALGGVSETLEGTVQLVLTDPPYNIRRENDRVNSSYDTLSRQDMESCVSTITDMLRPGGHAILFCTYKQSYTWRCLFQKVEYEGRRLYQVDDGVMVFVPVPGHSSRSGSRFQFALRNVNEYALHVFRHPGSGGREEALKHVQYKKHGYVSSSQPGYSSTIDNVPRLAPGEKVTRSSGGNGRNAFLRAEQKSVSVLKELISRFSAPGDTVVDMFAGTFSTAVATLSAREHRVFVGCDMDELCVQKGKMRIIDTFAAMVHGGVHRGQDWDVEVPPILEQNANLVYEHITGMRATGFVKGEGVDSRWKAPSDLPMAQKLPEGVVSVVAKIMLGSVNVEGALGCGKAEVCSKLYGLLESKAPSGWPPELFVALSDIGGDALLIAESEQFGVIVTKDGMGDEDRYALRASRAFLKGSYVGTISGTLVYRSLVADRVTGKTKVYGTGIFGVTPSRFMDTALCVVRKGKNSLVPSPSPIFVVPGVYSSLRHGMILDVEGVDTNAVVKSNLVNKVVNEESMITANNVVEVFATKNIPRFGVITIDCSSLSTY